LLNVLHIKRKKDAEKVQLNFLEIFQKEKESLAGQILKSKAEVHFDFNDAPTIAYYRAYLESIAHNLLSNALKYRSPLRDPVISVKTETRTGRTYLHVTDNGLGIDIARYGDQIFGLRKTFHEHPDARGIGLFMTKTQIEALGGRIQVQSVAGEGTTFTVEF
jgi:signal transduction histidine kinase